MPGGMDPGLGVFFMDLTVKAIDPSLDYDDDGKMARSGVVNEEVRESRRGQSPIKNLHL